MPSPNRFTKLSLYLALFALALLLFSGTYGFFAPDFFSLWGLHPKTVWATGHFFTAGRDLPTAIPYQSIFGSLLGWTLHTLKLPFPDFAWGTFNTLMVLALTGHIIFLHRRQINSLALCLVPLLFLLLGPREFRQCTFGGYADLVATLFLTLGLSYLRRQQVAVAALALAAMIFTKPTFFTWGLVLALAHLFSGPRVTPLRKKLVKLGILVGAALLANQLIKWLYYPEGSTAVARLGFKQRADYGWLDYLHLPFALLLANNGLVLLSGFATLPKLKRRDFWALYFVGGYLSLLGFYLVIMGPTPHEKFASINRYTLPLIVPLIVWIFEWSPAWATRRFKNIPVTKIFLGILGAVLILRSLEEFDIVRRRGFVNRFAICTAGAPLCAVEAHYRTQIAARPECPHFQLSAEAFARRFPQLGGDEHHLQSIYLLLPARVFISPVAKEGACLLD